MKKFTTFEKIHDPIVRYDGSLLFETYGDDLESIMQTNPRNVWTLLDCDGKLVIGAGYHLVNRIAYIVSRVPWFSESDCFSY